jgi:hypothetical protein
VTTYLPDVEESLLPTRAVCARYQVVPRTIERWVEDEGLGFPQPLFINRRKYFRQRELEAFERRRAAPTP